ncbi:TonB-dependent siderophore receptor [Candidatus Rickettsiella viridis]|uniref:TonB-dependent siderophore receptor n=1 Tax=Candidatus Rickettsiella viridis TaxID=676208 RepID=A0A2Z5UV67_9COXI|nr:hypothetical protein [Candidatus Rickettsiella viridis]BBB14955.1 TonB-dependent siderophore receptor [Candidatus Rickettsiella viridis]
MFNLANVITSFNQIYQKKVKLNKNWGLFYLQPEILTILNSNAQLLQEAVNYEPPFAINRKEQFKTSAEKKSQSEQVNIASLRDGIQKMNLDRVISQRLSWEGRFLARLNNDQVWLGIEEQITQKNESIKQYFRQVRQNWNIHKPFQYHSSEGLLFLLDTIIKYQDIFSLAYKELQQNQQTWFPFSRLPSFIAEAYEAFLKKELEKFDSLSKEVLAALLLRLKTVEQQGLVTCDDVSYTLALQSEWLGLIKFKLPEYRTVLDVNTFNDMQRAIEKHGDESHKSQLYQLAWYQSKIVGNTNEFTTITMSGSRLLTLYDLLAFMSKKKKKWFWFSWGNNTVFQFLEKQQALLTQLFLEPVHDTIILNPIYKSYPELLTLSTQYQLLQQSLFSLKKQPTYWWQWEKKFWKKAWQDWLGQQIDNKRVSLLNKLNETFKEVKKYNFELRNVKFREQVQVILKTIQALRSEGIAKCGNESLINMLQYINEKSSDKKEACIGQTHGSTKASPQPSPHTPNKNAQVLPMMSGGNQQDLYTTESNFNLQLVNSGKNSYRRKMTGLWKTKFSAGDNEPISTKQEPEINKSAGLARAYALL